MDIGEFGGKFEQFGDLLHEYLPKAVDLVNEGIEKHIFVDNKASIGLVTAAVWCFYIELLFDAVEPILGAYCQSLLNDYKNNDKSKAPLPAELLEKVLGEDIEERIAKRYGAFKMEVSAEIEKHYANIILKD